MSCAKGIWAFYSFSTEAIYGSLLKQRLDNQRLQTAQAATNFNSKQCPCPASCTLTSVRAQEENHGLGCICLRPSFLGMLLQMLSITSESVTLAYGQICMCNSTRCPFVCEQPHVLLSLHTGFCFLQNKHFLPWEETQLPRAAADQQKPAHSKRLSALTVTSQGAGPQEPQFGSIYLQPSKPFSSNSFKSHSQKWARCNSAGLLSSSIPALCSVVGGKQCLIMLMLFRVVSAHGIFMMWLGANPISHGRWGTKKLQALAGKALFLFKLLFLLQTEHCLLESTASLLIW